MGVYRSGVIAVYRCGNARVNTLFVQTVEALSGGDAEDGVGFERRKHKQGQRGDSEEGGSKENCKNEKQKEMRRVDVDEMLH